MKAGRARRDSCRHARSTSEEIRQVWHVRCDSMKSEGARVCRLAGLSSVQLSSQVAAVQGEQLARHDGAQAGNGHAKGLLDKLQRSSVPWRNKSHNSEGIPLSELYSRYLQQRRGAASVTRARARTRPALAAALPRPRAAQSTRRLAPSPKPLRPCPHAAPSVDHVDVRVHVRADVHAPVPVYVQA